MGCTASRLDNEDTVRRCKERRRLMKEAVHSRHHLASAHSEYLRSLRITGSTLTSFAAGEPLSVSDRTPPVFLHNTPNPIPPSDDTSTQPPPTPHPPPPPPPFSPSPFSTTPGSKLPHILSEPTSPASTRFYKPSPPAAAAPAAAAAKHPRVPAVNSTYATTPSQASSAWDWENFYPPSPPDSDFFDRRRKEQEEEEQNRRQHHLHREEEDEHEEEGREEVHCSEWGGNYSTSTSSSTKSDGEEEEQEEGEVDTRSEGIATRSDFRGSSSMDTTSRLAPSEIGSSARATAAKLAQRGRSDAGSSSAGWSRRDDGSALEELKMVVRHHNLAEIVAAIEEYFVKAAAAGDAVSDLLEIGRAQFEGSFRQLKKTVYHSNSVLSTLSSSWTSKPPLAIRYRLDTAALGEESGGRKSHASTLERLLAWEKKLYEEVKAREGVKIEHEKKLSTLQSQEYKGRDDSKLDKTKASIKKLQSLIIVTSQAVSTTSSAIIRVRDDELAQQLVEFCYSLMNMWRLMNQSHEVQNQIVQQVRGLVNNFSARESTSDLQRLATRDLEAAVSSWHSSFNLLIKHQRDYICALCGWLKLTHFPVSGDDLRKDHSSAVSVELIAFCDEWKQALDRLPDTVASEAIKSFVNVVHVISTKQAEELKIKKRAESYSRELEKKSTALRAVEKKYYQSYSMVGLGLPDGGHDGNGQVFDARDPLAEKKSEIVGYRRKVEDEMTRHAKAVEVTRSMTLNNIQTGLPGVFQAMTGFSGLFAKALQEVCRRAGHP